MADSSPQHHFTLHLLKGYSNPEFVAEGGNGCVWKATFAKDDGTTEFIAIKVIRDVQCKRRMVQDKHKFMLMKRVYREVSIMNLFKGCELFVQLRDMYMSPGGDDLYLVMPFIDHSLSSVIRHHQVANIGLQESTVRYIVMQVLVGLDIMARCHCIHRDLSPANILIGSECYDAYIGDFGLSRAFYEPGYDITNVELVTLPYRPPEIALRGRQLDNRIDIWSLGIVAVELLLGRNFIHGKDDLTQLRLILSHVARPATLEETRAFVSDAAFNFLSNNWPTVASHQPSVCHALCAADRPSPPSQQCLDVLQAMLQFNPMLRKSAAELLEMPWFTDSEDADTMRELMAFVTQTAPASGFSDAIESASYDEMLNEIFAKCSGKELSECLELEYQGKFWDK